MIEINLLPEEMRRQKKSYFKFDLADIARVKFLAGGIFAGVMALLVIIPALGANIRGRQILALLEKEKNLMPQKTNVEAINNEIAVLKVKLSALDDITKRRFLWSRKLNELSDLVLPGIWFNRIGAELDNNLTIEGSVISKNEEAMASVGKFIKNIKDDKLFFGDFSDIKLESVQRENIDKRDVVEFTIVLYF